MITTAIRIPLRGLTRPPFARIVTSCLQNRTKQLNTRNVNVFKTSPEEKSTHRRRWFSSMNPNDFLATSLIDSATYEVVCSETIESLCDYFEELVEECPHLKAADVTYGDGVLTVNFGSPYGTYVINRQSPNKQIWLSSPTSGPKRYDFIPDKDSDAATARGFWVYKHDGVTLHDLLQQEIAPIAKKDVNFSSLPFSKAK
ncbi:frataxin homolog, mitochondrial [Uranotaenia lowii]|uniref:frataxin homolog, mitochondrial n=1 Tax=Uranotaenia lowii TaxID=190385 RepID=UPI002479A530|nr:frataxin homolog, mitochondrial [Uranotaenia lowii]